MRLPDSAHLDQPWRIHGIAPDFPVEDVWAFDTPGAGRGDFATVLKLLDGQDPEGENGVVRALFAVRWKLGEIFGWDAETPDDPDSLVHRIPTDLRANGRLPSVQHFTSLYATDTEFAAELKNSTMHGILHLGWVAHGSGFRPQMAVLVKPNGRKGELYMAAIKPFRYGIVYPLMTKRVERIWRERERTLGADA